MPSYRTPAPARARAPAVSHGSARRRALPRLARQALLGARRWLSSAPDSSPVPLEAREAAAQRLPHWTRRPTPAADSPLCSESRTLFPLSSSQRAGPCRAFGASRACLGRWIIDRVSGNSDAATTHLDSPDPDGCPGCRARARYIVDPRRSSRTTAFVTLPHIAAFLDPRGAPHAPMGVEHTPAQDFTEEPPPSALTTPAGARASPGGHLARAADAAATAAAASVKIKL